MSRAQHSRTQQDTAGQTLIFHTDGFGDLLVCFKSLYALKSLYPQYKLILFHSGYYLSDKEFLKNISFIDEIVYYEDDFFNRLKGYNPDIFISIRRSSSFFKKLKELHLKQVIVFPHFYSVFRTNFTTPLFFRGKKHMSECVLNLVRQINKNHYDRHFSTLNFSEIRKFLPYSSDKVEPFFQDLKNYKKIIAINPFSNHSERTGTNFFLSSWINMALEFAREYPNFCFILLNFEKNPMQFKLDTSANLKIFINDDSLASLVGITKRLDYLISIDTGNVHLADILQIPTFVFTRLLTAYRFSGGSYGGEFDKLMVKPCWQKQYQKTLKLFTNKVKEKLDKLGSLG